MAHGIWKATALSIALVLATGAVEAASGRRAATEEIRNQVESSLLVTGTIDIRTDGSVAGHALDGAEKLADGVVDLVAKAVEGWRFEPFDLAEGTSLARTQMSLRLVARPLDETQVAVEIAAASFGSPTSDAFVTPRRALTRPEYPAAAARVGAGGIVYVVARVDREGRVSELVAEQVDLYVAAPPREMDLLRKMFTESALRTARRWRFQPPITGEEADEEAWSIRIPIEFLMEERGMADPFKWRAYIPGPSQPIPWLADKPHARNSFGP